jgi:hypothetical protein
VFEKLWRRKFRRRGIRREVWEAFLMLSFTELYLAGYIGSGAMYFQTANGSLHACSEGSIKIRFIGTPTSVSLSGTLLGASNGSRSFPLNTWGGGRWI